MSTVSTQSTPHPRAKITPAGKSPCEVARELRDQAHPVERRVPAVRSEVSLFNEGRSNKAEQFVVRNSNTKVHTKVGCGFSSLLGLDFRNPPDFRIPRNSSFQKRETKVFFFDFRKRKSDTKSNPETKVLLYRRNESRNESRNEVRIQCTKVPNKQTVARMGPGPFQRT